MKVRILTSRVGIGWSEWPGDIVDLQEDDARERIRLGKAEAVDNENPEPASVGPPAGAALSTHKHSHRKGRR